jgi:hypothetical protein
MSGDSSKRFKEYLAQKAATNRLLRERRKTGRKPEVEKEPQEQVEVAPERVKDEEVDAA